MSRLLAAAVLLAAILPAPAAWADPQPSKAPVPGPTAPPKLPVLAQARFNPAAAKNNWGFDRTGAAALINGFRADGQGLGVLYWTLRNDNAENVSPSSFGDGSWGSRHVAPTAVKIVDDRQRHSTLLSTTGCLCYLTPPGIAYSTVGKGEAIALAQMFFVSPTATKITVEIPGFQPVPGVPVQR
jgi:hypothetical protein